MTYTLPLAQLKAVALAAAKQDLRYYLNGVQLTVSDKGTFLVATDGHRMHAMRVADAPLPVGTEVILPITLIDALKINKRDGEMVTLDIAAGTAKYGTSTHSWSAVDGKFPAWPRALPRGASWEGAGASISPAYLMDLHKAARLLGDNKHNAPQLEWSGRTGSIRGLIDASPDFVATIMPTRQGKTPVLVAPAWAA